MPIEFPPFRLDPADARLSRGAAAIALRPKTFAVLQYLAERPGQLVTKRELLDAVWADINVTDGALKVCIREVRKALEDSAQQPKYIATEHRRGYRFIAATTGAAAHPRVAGVGVQPAAPFIGRDAEVLRLGDHWQQALSGRRQVVFITGEPGIGKTTLVEALLATIRTASRDAWVARGQCIEQYGAAEAFLPILEGLGRLCRQPGGERLVALLRAYAPSWLLQLPGLIPANDRAALQREYSGTSRKRMLRELVVGLEAVTADTPLVLVLEDLHWSDVSTLEVIAALARRVEPARLLVLGSYRAVDATSTDFPLQAIAHELLLHRQCAELSLGGFGEAAVSAYLAIRFGGRNLAPTLAPLIYECTDGNPLFMVNVADHLVARGLIAPDGDEWRLQAPLREVEHAVPQSLRHMLQTLLDALPPAELRVLEIASVAGVEFSGKGLTAALARSGDDVEARCRQLVRRRRFLRSLGSSEWPDNTLGARYAFTHALYQDVLYTRIPPARRRRLHQQIGERLEAGYRERTAEIAAELAMHFERARDTTRAIRYCRQAAQNALQRHASQEAIAQLTNALDLLSTEPATAERDQQELDLRILLGIPLLNTKGFAAPDVERTYARALALCRRLGERPRLFSVIEGLHSFYAIRGDIPTAYDLARQMLRQAESTQDPTQLIEAHHTMGCSEFFRAVHPAARSHLETAIALYGVEPRATAFHHSGHDPKVCCLCHLGLTLWFAGYADQGLQRIQQAVACADALRHPESVALARMMAAWLHLLRGETSQSKIFADATLALAREHGLAYWAAVATMFRGTTTVARGDATGGLEQLRSGFAGAAAIGVGKVQYLAMLADSNARCGRANDGLAAVAEALETIARTGERYLEAELLRLKGELLLQAGSRDDPARAADAEACFRQALAVARRQGARILELRSARSLSRLWRNRGRASSARRLLTDVYRWFTEGFETADLRVVAALLRDGCGVEES